MLDLNRTTRRARATIRLTVDCPVCRGSGQVALPTHDGSTDHGHLDPAGATMVDEDCGCDAGEVTLLLDTEYIEDMIAVALEPAINHAVRGFDRDDREFLRDDISTSEAASDIMADLTITLDYK